jgi:hypothetical protein
MNDKSGCVNNIDFVLKNKYNIDRLNVHNKDAASNILLIQQESLKGRGLFSLVSAVICYIDIAEKYKLIPVIDFENYPTVYNDPEYRDSNNAWEYYFNPVSSYDINNLPIDANVFITDSKYPKGYDYSISSMPFLLMIYDKFIRLNEQAKSALNLCNISVNASTLGVHFRGQEMRTARGHWLPPNNKQIFTSIDRMLSTGLFNEIFLVTEDLDNLKAVIKRYGNLVKFTDSYRTSSINAYKIKPRQMHFYNLGLEILIDALILGNCGGLIHCSSNVAEFSKFINNGRYVNSIYINNGPNSKIYPLNFVLWRIKSALSEELGGFSTSNQALIQYRQSVPTSS